MSIDTLIFIIKNSPNYKKKYLNVFFKCFSTSIYSDSKQFACIMILRESQTINLLSSYYMWYNTNALFSIFYYLCISSCVACIHTKYQHTKAILFWTCQKHQSVHILNYIICFCETRFPYRHPAPTYTWLNAANLTTINPSLSPINTVAMETQSVLIAATGPSTPSTHYLGQPSAIPATTHDM